MPVFYTILGTSLMEFDMLPFDQLNPLLFLPCYNLTTTIAGFIVVLLFLVRETKRVECFVESTNTSRLSFHRKIVIPSSLSFAINWPFLSFVETTTLGKCFLFFRKVPIRSVSFSRSSLTLVYQLSVYNEYPLLSKSTYRT